MGDEIESPSSRGQRSTSLRLSLQRYVSSLGSSNNNSYNSERRFDEEIALQWAAIERLPTFKRRKTSLFDDNKAAAGGGTDDEANQRRRRKRVVDVTKLDALERHTFIHNLIKHIEHDNLCLLQKIRRRMDKVGIELPTVKVRYDNLHIQAECEVVYGKPLPTLWHSFKRLILDLARLPGLKSEMSRMDIIDGVSGVIKPGRMTLLLGPPGCGKSTLLKALSGNLDKSLKTSGEISYNEHKLKELVPQKHSAYISQQDLHIPDMTVRETLDFSSCCQGVGIRAEIMAELSRREKIAGILPDPDIDTYMKAIAVEGEKATLQTDYVLRILGLGVCADTQIGDVMRRGISGGQKKRLTTGEMVVGPTKALFMDEISNGLDSSTTYEIVACLQHLAHITDATIVVSLLQPAPETFDLFDDIILLAEGKIVYHGPRENVVEFFESCGFRCPQRKGISDFLQEVISKKDQAQYWYNRNEAYSYHSVDKLSTKFKESSYGKIVMEQLSQPLAKSKSSEGAISFSAYSMPKLSLFRVCMWREFLLMKRNAFVYGFKAVQLFIVGCITMTMFLRSRMGNVDLANADYYMGALFYGLINFLLDGYPELAMTVSRLPVFYKQRDLCFYPAWAYAVPTAILKIPVSMLAAVIWTCLTYYVIGYSPGLGRFLRQMLLLFSVHLTSQSLFRFLASLAQTTVASGAIGSFSLVFLFVFSGFIIPRPSMPKFLQWGFWISPLSYGEIGLALDEFQSRRWHEMLPINATVGQQTLQKHGLNFDGYVFWISIGALFGFALLFNIGFTLALTLLRAPGSRSIISQDKFSRKEKHIEADKTIGPQEVNMVLPFQPLTVVFQNLQYHIEPTSAMKGHGFGQKKLQLLHEMTGTFRPGVLTALMGVSGAGKTTLFDVLAGRKTTGTIEGEIKIGGYPKVQKTFARISGYCEQTDLHSPNITVEESVIFSAWLRLPPEIDSRTKYNLVKSVLETIELDEIKDAMVGMPGANALSNEQRKRLTIAVELVANPSIIFLDEPTTGLDARAAAIVMRAVKNVADTGRTIVCTIHQPSIHIFETFDEIILLKSGGRLIYCGPLGQHSRNIIEYFESIPNVPKIRNSYNPATWILEITSSSSEAKLGVDFEEIYKNSALHKYNKELAETMSLPPPETKDLDFSSVFSQDGWGQFKTCLWRHSLSYWRCPSYNLRRLMFMLILSLMFGGLFWNQGKKIENQQSLFNLFGSMFTAVIFCGMNNSVSVLPYVTIERTVFYRERFSGMYAFWAHALAQVVMEIPYNLVQAVVFTAITYPMIGYYPSGYKVFWYCYAMFCTLFYYTSLGMMVVSITPSYPVAVMLQSAFNTFLTLFAGFLVPPPRIPKWWIWFYYITPTAWSLRGMITSQYGDIHENIEAFEGVKSVATFLEDYYGFNHKQLPIDGVVLILFPIIFAVVFAFSIEYLRFQRR